MRAMQKPMPKLPEDSFEKTTVRLPPPGTPDASASRHVWEDRPVAAEELRQIHSQASGSADALLLTRLSLRFSRQPAPARLLSSPLASPSWSPRGSERSSPTLSPQPSSAMLGEAANFQLGGDEEVCMQIEEPDSGWKSTVCHTELRPERDGERDLVIQLQ
eukprot:s2273_g1.t1